MRTVCLILFGLLAVTGILLTATHLAGARKPAPPGHVPQSSARGSAAAKPVLANPALAAPVTLSATVAEAGADDGLRQANPVERRLAALEAQVKRLQEQLNGVTIEKASADRQESFAADEGYLKADEYFEAGKYAIAGEGYLTFLQNHPDHADARDVMKKARDSFLQAGYKDKAFWVHEEMMKGYPQHRERDLWEQAQLEKEAGLYDRAVDHAAQAAELASNPEERLWRRLYWAWYVQLRDGSQAGISALEQVQREIAASGVQNPKLVEHATRRMQEWQRQSSRP